MKNKNFGFERFLLHSPQLVAPLRSFLLAVAASSPADEVPRVDMVGYVRGSLITIIMVGQEDKRVSWRESRGCFLQVENSAEIRAEGLMPPHSSATPGSRVCVNGSL